MDAAVRALMAIARAKVASPDQEKAGPLGTQARLLDALTEWFASAQAVHASELPLDLVDGLVAFGISRKVARQVGEMVLANPMSGRTRHGAPQPTDGMTAMRRVASEEPRMRAQYVLAAAQRLTTASDISADEHSAMTNELRYLGMHVAAGRKRRVAARMADVVSKNGALLLIWRTQHDDRVDARCAILEGRLFRSGHPPGGAYPGSVHLRCRCYPEAFNGPLFL